MREMPEQLRKDLAQLRFRDLLPLEHSNYPGDRSSPLLMDMSDSLRREIVSCLHPLVLTQGERVFCAGEPLARRTADILTCLEQMNCDVNMKHCI